MPVKYIFATGGVVSGLGKGVTAASLGRLLKQRRRGDCPGGTVQTIPRITGELKRRIYSLDAQFHPELKSRPNRACPLFREPSAAKNCVK